MGIKQRVAGTFFIASGLMGISGGAEAADPRVAPVAVKRPVAPQAARSADLATVLRLLDTRAMDAAAQRDLTSIAANMAALHDGSLVGAWGLGCGAGCANGITRYDDQTLAQRTEAINAARISAGDKALLLKINTSIETVRKLKGELVGAWGLGCGGSCSRPLEDLGNVAAQPR